MTEQERAEAYHCNTCGDDGFGGWNCTQCGGHDIERREVTARDVYMHLVKTKPHRFQLAEGATDYD